MTDQRDTTTKQNTKFPTLTATDIKTRDSRMLAILLDIPDTAKAAFLSYDFHPQLRNRLFRLPPTPPKYHAPVAAADLLPVEYVLALCRPNGSNPTMSEMTAICDDVEKYCQLIQRPARGARLQMRALKILLTVIFLSDLTKGLERIIELDAETEEEDVVPSIENQGVSGGADDAIDLTGDDD